MGKLQSEKKKGKKTAAPTNGVFFYLFMEMLLGSHVPSHHSLEVRWRAWGRGQSVMAKKTLEDERGTPPGPSSTELID